MKGAVKDFNKFWKDSPLVGWTIVLLLVLAVLTVLALIGLWTYRTFTKKKLKEDSGASRSVTVRMSPSPVSAEHKAGADSSV